MHGQVPGPPGQYGGHPGGQPAPGFQAPPQFAPPPGAPRPKGPPWWIWVVGAVGLALVLSISGVVLWTQRASTVSGPLKTEQCVGKRFELNSSKTTIPATTRVDCADPEAKAKVAKITREGQRSAGSFVTFSNPDCPDGADGVVRVSLKPDDARYWEACVRNLKGPHPGDPGAGGAMLSKGDCVSGGSFGGGGEKPCSGKGWYGKVIARVDTPAACPAPQTLEIMKLRSFGGGTTPRPVLCLGQEGSVVGPGDCIEDPSFAFTGLEKAPCGSANAVAKAVARVKSTGQCPSSATHYLRSKDEEAYLAVLCLQRLRPTALEQLDALAR